MALLDSQGIVVKCTAAIFSRTVPGFQHFCVGIIANQGYHFTEPRHVHQYVICTENRSVRETIRHLWKLLKSTICSQVQ